MSSCTKRMAAVSCASREGCEARRAFASAFTSAVEREYGRMEWSVLRWNESAIRVYDAIGAEALSGWLTYRLTGDGLRQMAAGTKPGA